MSHLEISFNRSRFNSSLMVRVLIVQTLSYYFMHNIIKLVGLLSFSVMTVLRLSMANMKSFLLYISKSGWLCLSWNKLEETLPINTYFL